MAYEGCSHGRRHAKSGHVANSCIYIRPRIDDPLGYLVEPPLRGEVEGPPVVLTCGVVTDEYKKKG